MDELIVNIGKSADASAESAKNILELEERTRRIDKIVDAIVMVTVQTKMLAVNGNVEAARAGEYGRGFSVVAGDIRSLANESSENADRIKDLVKNVQTQIARVAGDIEHGRGPKHGQKWNAPKFRARIWIASPRIVTTWWVCGRSKWRRRSGRGVGASRQSQRSRSPLPPRKRRAPPPKQPALPSRA